jgi:hypothetical protein
MQRNVTASGTAEATDSGSREIELQGAASSE